jgi:hypothetical protein
MSNCTVYESFCEKHDFCHGAEAEELRHGIEKMMLDLDEYADFEGRVYAADVYRLLASLLDRIDARDSVAYLEAKKKEDSDV